MHAKADWFLRLDHEMHNGLAPPLLPYGQQFTRPELGYVFGRRDWQFAMAYMKERHARSKHPLRKKAKP